MVDTTSSRPKTKQSVAGIAYSCRDKLMKYISSEYFGINWCQTNMSLVVTKSCLHFLENEIAVNVPSDRMN